MYKIWLKRYLLGRRWLNGSFNCKTVANNDVRKALSWIITQISAMTAFSSSNKAAETGSKKAGNMIFIKNFRILRSFLGNLPIVGLDVWEHISPSLESTGVISHKFWKALEMTFYLVHSHFSVLNRWTVIRILVKISEARIRYRNFSRIFACKIFSAGLIILIMKTRNSRCWVKWALRLSLGCLYRRFSVFL